MPRAPRITARPALLVPTLRPISIPSWRVSLPVEQRPVAHAAARRAARRGRGFCSAACRWKEPWVRECRCAAAARTDLATHLPLLSPPSHPTAAQNTGPCSAVARAASRCGTWSGRACAWSATSTTAPLSASTSPGGCASASKGCGGNGSTSMTTGAGCGRVTMGTGGARARSCGARRRRRADARQSWSRRSPSPPPASRAPPRAGPARPFPARPPP